MSEETTNEERSRVGSHGFELLPETQAAFDKIVTAEGSEEQEQSPAPKPGAKEPSGEEPKGKPKPPASKTEWESGTEESEESKDPDEPKEAEESKTEEGGEEADEGDEPKSPKDYLLRSRPSKEQNLANLRETNTKLRLEVQSLRKKTESNSDYESLKTRNQELEQIVQMVSAERSPEFKQQIEAKISPKISIAKQILPGKATEIERLLRAPASQERNQEIEALVEDLSPLQAGRFANLMNEIDSVGVEKDALLKDYASKLDALTEEQRAVQTQQQKQQLAKKQQAFDRMLIAAQDKLEVFQTKEDDDDWNRGVQERIDIAKRIVTGQFQDADDMSAFALTAAAFPGLASSYEAAAAKIAELEAQVEKLQAGKPSPTGGSKTGGTSSDAGWDPSKEEYSDYIQRTSNGVF